ncbi:AAA family ATPase [Svornostia abyssi]|uniref:AAA family ATPase n=1 Tax=Svornostia abyssi TaxID=2898438 RepID=A0ABY5PM59_9ACTN|nr:AAA family ATPase [Parviterribacteraceae bacterium J379]
MSPDGLLERDDELAVVDELLAGAAASEGRFLLIEGPAGIGKSRVLAEVRARAGRRMTVLAARGGELEGSFPFGVVRQLFEGVLADPERAARLCTGAAAPARDVLEAPTGNTQAGGASFAVLHGLYWLVLNLAEEEPLVLAIDDLHWVDRPSLRFLAYLARRLDGAPVLLAATLRSAEPGVDPVLLAELVQDPAVASLRPRPLSEDAVGALLAERLGEPGEPAFVEACHRATGGNPLLLRQLLGALAADRIRPVEAQTGVVREIAPRAVSRTVLLRLGRLDPSAAAAARAVAVLGDGATPRTVSSLAGLTEDEVIDASRALVRAELLTPEMPLRFVHPLVRDAVYQEVTPAEREQLHARAAAVLRDVEAGPEQVANQLLLTPPAGEAWAADALIRAGHDAIARGAPDGAVAYLRRALAEPPPPDIRADVLRELAFTEAQTTATGAAEHLRRALEATEDAPTRAEIAQALARTLIFTGEARAGLEVAHAAMAELPADDRDALLGLRALEVTCVHFGAADPEVLQTSEPFRHAAGDTRGEAMLGAIAAMLWAHDGGPADDCCALALRMLTRLRHADDPLISVGAFYVLHCAERDEVLDLWETARADAHRSGALVENASMHSWYGHALLRRGDLAQARIELELGFDQVTQWGYSETVRLIATAWLVNALVAQGELDAAEQRMRAVTLTPEPSVPSFAFLYARAELSLAQGDAEAALEACDEGERRASWIVAPVGFPWPVIRALALDRVGRTDEALAVARGWLEVARGWGAPGTVGTALRVLGTIEREDGLDRLRDAVEVLEGSSARLERARALAAYGAALRRARQPTEAREPLRRALDLAVACDAAAVAEDIRTELHAAGARPRTDALSGVEALTPSERRVVDLAAAGQANREIAQTLFVTPKTVEVHLTNAYRKLGVKSRRELGDALVPSA